MLSAADETSQDSRFASASGPSSYVLWICSPACNHFASTVHNRGMDLAQDSESILNKCVYK